VVAAAVHLGLLYAIPSIVMARVAAQMGRTNTMNHGRRPDASWHIVVRPSTDLLYSQCPYDLSGGPLLVTAPVPKGTWWAVAAYDSDTNNYYVRDDRQLHDRLRLLIYPPDAGPAPRDPGTVISPTKRGIVIIRTLIDSEPHLPELDRIRQKSRCSILR
jgi:uncharacterized membrane protein